MRVELAGRYSNPDKWGHLTEITLPIDRHEDVGDLVKGTGSSRHAPGSISSDLARPKSGI
jgi:hypothetical protein